MPKALYDQLETAIAKMDLSCSSFNDYEEQMKNLTNNTPNGKNRKRKQKSPLEIKNFTKQQAKVACTNLLNKCSKV